MSRPGFTPFGSCSSREVLLSAPFHNTFASVFARLDELLAGMDYTR